VVLALLVAAGGVVVLYLKPTFPVRSLYKVADFLFTWLMPALLAPVFWVAARAMLWLNPRFLAAGRIDRLRGDAAADRE
jgi:hypothetical protein